MRVRLKQDRLRDLLAASRLSQNAWAMRVGVSRGHWSDIVNGKHPYPSAKTRAHIVEALGVAFEELFEIDAVASAAPPSRPPEPLSDRYVLDREVGEGAMGIVYLARDTRFGRQVAIKFVSEEAVGGLGSEQFIKELRRTARLQHPAVLPLYDAGETAGRPYYVMPYLAEGSLRDRLDREGRLALPAALRVLEGIAGAIEHAHGQGVLHCDIKPQNVLLAGDHAYVADFGLSRAIHLQVVREWERAPEVDTAAGTPAYVSPEQARARVDLDARSDVYSLACVFFEMLAGRPPYAGGSTTEVVQRRFESLPPDLSAYAPGVPDGVGAVVQAALAVDREQRPATPNQLVQRLRLAASGAIAGAARHATIASSVATALGGWAAARPPRQRGLLMASLFEDLRYSFRSLVRRPLFTSVATITLALGIGANAAIFSVVNAAILTPLPYQDPDRLARIYSTYQGQLCCTISAPNFQDLRPEVSEFVDIAAYSDGAFTLTGGEDPAQLSGYRVTSGLFELLGVRPQRGRWFSEDDDRFGAEPTVVLGDRLWRDRYGADPEVIGGEVMVDSVARTVIGVAPAGFRVSGRPQLFIPFNWDPEQTPSRGSNFLLMIGRVAEGATLDSAVAELSTAYDALVASYPDQITNQGVGAVPLEEWLVGSSRQRPILLLWGAVGMVLLVACANVVNLMLARAETRQRELAVRAALGAGRGRLIRHFLVESLLLSTLGGVVGVAAAYGGLALLLNTYGSAVPRSDEAGIDLTVLGFTVAVALVTGIAVGLVPALMLRSGDLRSALAEGGRGSAGGRSLLRETLVVLEVAAALVLVIGAGLLLKSFWRLSQVELGVDASRLLTAEVSLPSARYGEQADVRAFYESFSERAAQLPGVEAIGIASAAPFSNTWTNYSTISPIGNLEVSAKRVEVRLVDEAFFDALGLHVLQGRSFDAGDGPDQPPPVIVNRELVRRLFGDSDPVGAMIGPSPESTGWQIVGVISDVMDHGPDRELPGMIYFSATQGYQNAMSILVRAAADPLALVPELRGIVRDLDPELPLFGVKRLDDMVADGLGSRTFVVYLLAIFAGVALTLGAIGIFGVMAYTVEQRTREIGLRQALGASPGRLLGGVVFDGLRMAAVGIILGSIGAYLLRQALASLLFEVSAVDPAIYAAVATLLAVAAAAACFVPGRRAATIDPMAALRGD